MRGRPAQPFDQPRHEALAARHLIERNPFVGLVGLGDLTEAAKALSTSHDHDLDVRDIGDDVPFKRELIELAVF